MNIQDNISNREMQETVVAQLPDVKQDANANSLLFTFLPVSLGIFGTILLILFPNAFLCVCKPSEVVVLSGRKRKTKSGQELGYRVLSGGRGIRIPILETIKRIDVTTMPVPVKVTNAYAKGGTPLDIQAIAKAKGDAASIIEDGKAQAEGTQRLAESWKAAGANAKDIFLFQKLEMLMKMMAAGVPDVEVESLTVIDQGWQ